MTRADEIRELYAYNRWANRRLVEAAAAHDDDALARDLGSSFPSVLATLAHIVSADWIWLRRWAGVSPTAAPADWALASLAAIRARWEDVETERSTVLSDLDDGTLGREVAYRNTAGVAFTSRMDEMLRHVVDHSTYHRGQVVTMLRQLGGTPPPTGLIVFYRERRAERGTG